MRGRKQKWTRGPLTARSYEDVIKWQASTAGDDRSGRKIQFRIHFTVGKVNPEIFEWLQEINTDFLMRTNIVRITLFDGPIGSYRKRSISIHTHTHFGKKQDKVLMVMYAVAGKIRID